MTRRKGRACARDTQSPCRTPVGRPRRETKRAKTAAARSYADLDRSRADLERQRAELEAAAAKVAERERAVQAKEAAITRKEQRDAAKLEAAQRREQESVERAAAAAVTRLSPKTSLYLEESEERVKPKTGSTLCKTQSRMILLLLISLRKDGQSENEAILRVSGEHIQDRPREGQTRQQPLVGTPRVVRDHLRGERQDHEEGRPAALCHRTCGFEEQPSNRSVGGLLSRLGYKRRRGRIKTPRLDAARLARIRRFLVEMDIAKRAEDAGLAVIVYMDESFVHQAHGSPYSYFPSDEDGVVQDGIGRTTGKGLRMIMVHAITKWGPLAKLCDGFPIEEGWFKSKGGGKGKRGGKDFNLEDEETAEFLWQAKLAKGDYHAAMTDSMFMEWLERRLSPAYNAVPDFKGKKMILVRDNASYHQGFDAEVKVPETNTKKYNVELLRRYGVRSIKVKRAAANGRVVQQRFEVPTDEGSTLPDARREGGVSREEVATATREYFRLNHPEKLEERVETFMREKGWELIWTPPYMPTFQPI
ncbi:unnamed protein product [Ectocarpus sp. CCAP 1310/34]|nr:unnamed protein product [Ectocarpus sp. CCAP 1310/34]